VTSDIHQLIGAINPDVFCARTAKREVKRFLESRNQSPDYTNAATKVIPEESNHIALDHLTLENPFHLPGFKSPTERHALAYDNFDDSLEAFYYWLLDELTAGGWTVDKLADTFAATPASGLFADLSRRESNAQHEALKLLRDAHSLIQEMLRATMPANPVSSDLVLTNGRGRSEVELNLLRSKVATLKLYARWLGPYLRQARQTKQSSQGGAAFPNLFNTATAEMILLAKAEYPLAEAVNKGDLPKILLKARRRKFFSVLIIELKLRAAPERTTPGAYGYRGRFDLTFTSYALNSDELAVLQRELDRENLDEVIYGLGEASGSTLNALVQQVETLVTAPKESESVTSDSNPFTALFDFSDWFGSGDSDTGMPVVGKLQPDSELEQVIRSQALLVARRRCLEFYDRCKQALKMPCF
jgi:hypothetical protein